MRFLERDLEDIIYRTPNVLLRERGLYLRGKKYRQLKIGKYGVADLVCFDKGFRPKDNDPDWPIETAYHSPTITVVELKKDVVNIGALFQSIGYLKGIMRYMDKRYPENNIQYRIVLIGSELQTGNSFPYIFEFMDGRIGLSGYTYEYDFNGLKFQQVNHGWSLTNEGF